MKAINELKIKTQYLFTDIDDTLTKNGLLPATSYEALFRLKNHGIKIVPITGRPAGWCEMIARMWPVDAVIGENGAFYFSYNHKEKKMLRHYSQSEETRIESQKKLHQLAKQIFNTVSGSAYASDQFCRQVDVAIDFCEDVTPLTKQEVNKIVDIFKAAGANAKISSIHVNAWFGEHNKLSMCKDFVMKHWQKKIDDILDQSIFCGDSPNDEPMFDFFSHSVGVANVLDFQKEIKSMPKYICKEKAADGFCEMTEHLLSL